MYFTLCHILQWRKVWFSWNFFKFQDTWNIILLSIQLYKASFYHLLSCLVFLENFVQNIFIILWSYSCFYAMKFMNTDIKIQFYKAKILVVTRDFFIFWIDMCQIMGTMDTRLYVNANYFSRLELSGSWHATTHLACWNGEQIVNESIWHYKYTLQMVSA